MNPLPRAPNAVHINITRLERAYTGCARVGFAVALQRPRKKKNEYRLWPRTKLLLHSQVRTLVARTHKIDSYKWNIVEKRLHGNHCARKLMCYYAIRARLNSPLYLFRAVLSIHTSYTRDVQTRCFEFFELLLRLRYGLERHNDSVQW